MDWIINWTRENKEGMYFDEIENPEKFPTPPGWSQDKWVEAVNKVNKIDTEIGRTALDRAQERTKELILEELLEMKNPENYWPDRELNKVQKQVHRQERDKAAEEGEKKFVLWKKSIEKPWG